MQKDTSMKDLYKEVKELLPELQFEKVVHGDTIVLPIGENWVRAYLGKRAIWGWESSVVLKFYWRKPLYSEVCKRWLKWDKLTAKKLADAFKEMREKIQEEVSIVKDKEEAVKEARNRAKELLGHIKGQLRTGSWHGICTTALETDNATYRLSHCEGNIRLNSVEIKLGDNSKFTDTEQVERIEQFDKLFGEWRYNG